MKIQVKLGDVIKDDKLLEKSGINPYCVNEGADPNAWIEVEVESVTVL
jgi:hypothetical protein